MSDDTKKRILALVERYGTARAQEELAGFHDNRSAMKRHYDAGKKAWDDIGAELDMLLAAAPPPTSTGAK